MVSEVNSSIVDLDSSTFATSNASQKSKTEQQIV